MSTIVPRCSRIANDVLFAVVISLITAATVALPLASKNTKATANKALTPVFSNHNSALCILSSPLPQPRRGGLLLFSSSHSSTPSSTTSDKSLDSKYDNVTTCNDKNNHSRKKSQEPATLAAETYTNKWDNLLMEEHRLALDEWRDRRSKCSLQTLENRGLAISRAFALPDSEILGEKTVRIHNGSGGKKYNINAKLDDGVDGDNSGDVARGGRRGKNKANERGRFRRPWNEVFGKGDILEMTANDSKTGFSSQSFRRECLVMDVGDTWMLVGVGKTWPLGVWGARKGLGSNSDGKLGPSGGNPSYGYPVRLDKTPNAAALTPLRAQRSALETVRGQQQKQSPMMVATWLTKTTKEYCKGYYRVRNIKRWANQSPYHFREIVTDMNVDLKDGSEEECGLRAYLRQAIDRVTKRRSLVSSSSSKTKNWSATANDSQREAVIRALSRRVSSIQGPPGTGKTRVAALLIATALEMAKFSKTSASVAANTNECNDDPHSPFRVLAVAHSNGAADVLLEALLELGVPAVRAGRPAAISSRVRHRSAVALAEKMPQVVLLRKELLAATRNIGDMRSSSNIEWELQQCLEDAQDALLDSAPVVVTSCVGAHQLSVRQDKLRERDNQSNEQDQQDLGRILASSDDVARFPLVVLDEAAQCTEPALMCALVAARADQLVMVGDTKQLPPTVASSSKALRESIGISPMERLEKSGLVRQTTLRIQYRMVQALLDHPSKYFYKGMVKSAAEFSPVDQNSLSAIDPPPSGFAWPNAILPLAFIDGGRGEAEVLHDSSLGLAGRSNPTEAKLVAQITADILEENELKSSQICVLTPYSKQVSVIRSTLEMESINRRYRKRNIDRINDDTMSNTQLTKTKATDMLKSINDVRVGTIDSFQGQETEVVIFSAVRSNSFAGLGFLRDPRRLCVALTRARKGLIIIGDSSVLKSCRHWRSLIESCQDRNCFINENHHSLSPSSNRNTKECDSDGDDNGRLETFIDGNNVGKVDEHQRNMKEREKLSMLKPDEEFLGLFSTQSCDSTEP